MTLADKRVSTGDAVVWKREMAELRLLSGVGPGPLPQRQHILCCRSLGGRHSWHCAVVTGCGTRVCMPPSCAEASRAHGAGVCGHSVSASAPLFSAS